MRLIAAVVLILTVCFQAQALQVIEKDYPPVNGVQIFVLSQEYARDYDKFFRELKAKNVDTVFFRVFHNSSDRVHTFADNPCTPMGGGVYFNSKVACTVSNMLPEIVEAGKRNGVLVYAWMATRSLSFLKTQDKMSLSFTPNGYTSGYGANIFNRDVRDAIKRLMMEIADTGVDGILIQDDFIMKFSEGADLLSCGRFTADTGIACTAENLFDIRYNDDGSRRFGNATANGERWYQWKAEQLQDLFKEMKDATRIINPNMKWALNIYYETPVYPHQGLAWYAQDMKGIWEAGADYVAVMTYQDQIMREKQLDRSGFLQFISDLSRASLRSSLVDKSRVIFKVQATEFGSGNPVQTESLELLCNRLRREGSQSIVQLPIYSAGDIIPVCGFQ